MASWTLLVMIEIIELLIGEPFDFGSYGGFFDALNNFLRAITHFFR